jgi:CheY-like chemotaxis protein
MLEHMNLKYNSKIVVDSVNNGKDAIELCRSESEMNSYNFVFMDINMPGMDGLTATKIIKSNKFYGRIIATTGNILAKKENTTFNEDSNTFKEFDDVIIKPYDDAAIIKVLIKYNYVQN